MEVRSPFTIAFEVRRYSAQGGNTTTCEAGEKEEAEDEGYI